MWRISLFFWHDNCLIQIILPMFPTGKQWLSHFTFAEKRLEFWHWDSHLRLRLQSLYKMKIFFNFSQTFFFCAPPPPADVAICISAWKLRLQSADEFIIAQGLTRCQYADTMSKQRLKNVKYGWYFKYNTQSISVSDLKAPKIYFAIWMNTVYIQK